MRGNVSQKEQKTTNDDNTIRNFKRFILEMGKCKTQQEFIGRSPQHASFWKKIEQLKTSPLLVLMSDETDIQTPISTDETIIDDTTRFDLLRQLSDILHPIKNP